MDFNQFKASLTGKSPPDGVTPALEALWHQGKDDWETAHKVAQEIKDADGAWVHAHLHRVEGDESNAAHWYRRAGQPVSEVSLEREWSEIAAALLDA